MSARSPFRDGGSLRARLIALVLIPLIGGGALAVARVNKSLDSARAATRTDGFVAGATAIDRARGAFQQEVIPAVAAALVRHPALVKTDAATLNNTSTAAITAQLPGLRRDTDTAVNALTMRPPIASAGRRLVAELTTTRQQIDQPQSLSSALSAASTFANDLATLERDQVAAATKAGIRASGLRALHDVDLISTATVAASQEIALYSEALLSTASGSDSPRERWVQGWGAYTAASAAVSKHAAAPLAQAWDTVNADPAVQAFNDFLAAQLTPTTTAATRILGLVVEDGARNKAYLAVLASALDRTLQAGRAQHDAATGELRWILVMALLVLLLSVIISLLVQQSLTKPLDRLAAQATLISQGQLTDVPIGGPREVRTVARALSSSVANLRNVEAHAAAVAAGDLESSAIRQPLPGPLGEVVHSSVARIIGAINDREAAQRELAHRAAHDPLTELPNRRQALVLTEQALHRAHRATHVTALMFVDLDHFKAVNDNFGHATGDLVLQAVARRMRRTVRDGDAVARLGGDEFVVLLEDVDDEADVVKLAERVVEEISAEMKIGHRSIRIGASIGIAFCRDGYVDAGRLLQEADAAAYQAKHSGRGRVDVFDDGLRAGLKKRAELERAITIALEREEFVLYYQPVIDLRTQQIESVEALIRWQRPGHGLVSPDEFIPVAERSTLINDIGRWVLREATDQLARWDRAEPGTSDLRMAINISGRHLASNQLPADVTDALAHSGIAPHRLVLEMTETVLIDELTANRNLDTLRALGVKIAIDDFGTGFTSIGQLSRMHVDTLKIDRSFVASADPTQQELIRLIVATAHAFGLSVVAEGIELQSEADNLLAAGAEYGQGYLFARPRPPDERFPRLQFAQSVPQAAAESSAE